MELDMSFDFSAGSSPSSSNVPDVSLETALDHTEKAAEVDAAELSASHALAAEINQFVKPTEINHMIEPVEETNPASTLDKII